MSYMGDVCGITGKYTDQSGQEKNRYIKVGAWFQTDKGISVKLDAVPFPNKDGDCWLSLFPAQQQQPAPQQQQQQPQQQRQQQQQPYQQQPPQRPPQGGGYY